jgi:hypothetical protein
MLFPMAASCYRRLAGTLARSQARHDDEFEDGISARRGVCFRLALALSLSLSLPTRKSAPGFENLCGGFVCPWVVCGSAPRPLRPAKPFRDGNGIAALASRGGESEREEGARSPGWEGKAVAADLSIRSEVCYVGLRHWLAAAPGPVGATGHAGSGAGLDGALTCAR